MQEIFITLAECSFKNNLSNYEYFFGHERTTVLHQSHAHRGHINDLCRSLTPKRFSFAGIAVQVELGRESSLLKFEKLTYRNTKCKAHLDTTKGNPVLPYANTKWMIIICANLDMTP